MCLHTKSFPDIFCWHLLLRKHSARACPWKVKSTILAWCRKTSTMPTLMSSPLGQSFFDVITAIIFVSPSHPSEPTPAIKAPSGNHQMFLKMLTVQSHNLGVLEFPKICIFTWTQILTLRFYKNLLPPQKKVHSLKTCPIALWHKPSQQSNHNRDITQLVSTQCNWSSWKGCLCNCANNNNVSQILQRDHRSSILIYVDIWANPTDGYLSPASALIRGAVIEGLTIWHWERSMGCRDLELMFDVIVFGFTFASILTPCLFDFHFGGAHYLTVWCAHSLGT